MYPTVIPLGIQVDAGDDDAIFDATALRGEVFGQACEADARALATAPNSLFAVRVDGRIAGLVSTRPAGERDAAVVARLFAPHTDHVGFLDDLVVAPTRRGAGLGTHLTEMALGHLAAQGCTTVVAEVWRSGENEGFEVMRRAGFEPLTHIERYWADRSRHPEHGWTCPHCGTPCVCPATLMVRSL